MTFNAAMDLVRGYVSSGKLPTAVFGIATAEGTVALEAFGSTGGRATRIDDRYLLFSLTKPLVGIAAARLIERGLLTATTPLTRALPEFGRDRDDEVQLRHLVSHTAGIVDSAMDSPRELREDLLRQPSEFRAGTASRYSTIAFEGVAALIEHASGRPWAAEVEAWAAEIGATGVSLDHEDAHQIVDAAKAGIDMDRFSQLRSPGAGLAGRADDLLKIAAELLRIGGGDTGVLHPATLAMMLRPLTGNIPRLEPYTADRGQDWGFTWNLRSRAPGLIDRDTFGHGGWAGTELWVQPGAGTAWVLLTNQESRDVNIDEIANAVTGAR